MPTVPSVVPETPCAGCERAVGAVGDGKSFTIAGRPEVLCSECYGEAMPMAEQVHAKSGKWPTTTEVLGWLATKYKKQHPEWRQELAALENEPVLANPAKAEAPARDDDWPTEIPVAENPEGPKAAYHHHRQAPPYIFEKKSFRTVPVSHSDYPATGRYSKEGAKAIVGRIKKQYRKKWGREGVRTPYRAWGVQSILTPKELKMPPTREEKARENMKKWDLGEFWHLRASENPKKPKLAYGPSWQAAVPLADLKRMWAELGNVPISDDGKTERAFYGWPAGEPLDEIHQWFDEKLPGGLGPALEKGTLENPGGESPVDMSSPFWQRPVVKLWTKMVSFEGFGYGSKRFLVVKLADAKYEFVVKDDSITANDLKQFVGKPYGELYNHLFGNPDKFYVKRNPVTKKEATAIAEFAEDSAEGQMAKHTMIRHEGGDADVVSRAVEETHARERQQLFRALQNPGGTCADCSQSAVVCCVVCDGCYCSACCMPHEAAHGGKPGMVGAAENPQRFFIIESGTTDEGRMLYKKMYDRKTGGDVIMFAPTEEQLQADVERTKRLMDKVPQAFGGHAAENPPHSELAEAEEHFREALRILKQRAEANPNLLKCEGCGKEMNPVERLMGPVCGTCARKKHREAAGENPHCPECERLWALSTAATSSSYVEGDAAYAAYVAHYKTHGSAAAGKNPTKSAARSSAESSRSGDKRARVLPTRSVKGGHSVFVDGKRFGKGRAKRMARKVAELHRSKGYLARVMPVKGGFEAFLGQSRVETMKVKERGAAKPGRAVRKAKRPVKVHRVRVKEREKTRMTRAERKETAREEAKKRIADALRKGKGENVYILPQMREVVGGQEVLVPTSDILRQLGAVDAGGNHWRLGEKTGVPAEEPSEAELASLVDEAAEAQSAATTEATEPSEQELADLASGK